MLVVVWVDNEMNKVECDFFVGFIECVGFGSVVREELMVWFDELLFEFNWLYFLENLEFGEDIL